MGSRVEMPLPETGLVPSLWRCKEHEMAWKVAGDGWQRQADLAGLAVSMGLGNSRCDGLMHSREGFGLGKVLTPFSFPSVDV